MIRPFLSAWCPPILKKWIVRKCKRFNWQGVYQSFQDVPRLGEGYQDENLVAQIKADVLNRLQSDTPTAHSMLGVLSAAVQAPVKIMDFGGGAGQGYIELKKNAKNQNIEYTIVELPKICAIGEELFRDQERILFTDHIPDSLFDIIYMNSCLQYIDDWQDLLRNMLKCKPEYFLLERASIGMQKDFITSQINLNSQVIPYRFLSKKSVVDFFASVNYHLVFERRDDYFLDMENFPTEYRLEKTCTLIFRAGEY